MLLWYYVLRWLTAPVLCVSTCLLECNEFPDRDVPIIIIPFLHLLTSNHIHHIIPGISITICLWRVLSSKCPTGRLNGRWESALISWKCPPTSSLRARNFWLRYVIWPWPSSFYFINAICDSVCICSVDSFFCFVCRFCSKDIIIIIPIMF